MIVSLFTEDRLYTVSLPEKALGKYFLRDCGPEGRPREAADAEGVQGSWVLHGSRYLSLLGADGNETNAVPLGAGLQVIRAVYRKGRGKAQFYVEPTTADRQTFRRYQVAGTCMLSIGREADNQIVYENRYVSAHHACLEWRNGQWTVTDTQSSNGTFVNESRIAVRQLVPGDMVCILGLKIIVGMGFFAVNDPDGAVRIAPRAAVPLQPQPVQEREMELEEQPEQAVFSPAPALHRRVEHRELRVDAPPNAQRMEETPLALLLGPAITMGMTAVVMAAMAVNNYTSGTADLMTVIPSLVMAFSMLCGTLLWPMLTRRSEKKKRLQAESARQRRYEEYLGQVRSQLFRIAEDQRAILLDNYPSGAQCEQAAIARCAPLWERGSGTDGFLILRMGLGPVPIDASLRFPEQRFAMEDDTLQNMVYRLAAEPKLIENAPVVCALTDHPGVGIAGPRAEAESYLVELAVQLAALHSSDEVKLVCLMGDAAGARLHSLRLLPHTWDNEEQTRYWACSAEDGKRLSSGLEKLLAERKERLVSGGEGARLPYYVLLVPDLAYGGQLDLVRLVMREGENCGASCIVLADDLASLPRECSMVVQLSGRSVSLFDRKKPGGPISGVQRDEPGVSSLDMTAAALANLNASRRSGGGTLPNMLTFLELYRSGKVEHLNALTRWRDNNPVISLQAPIGVDENGAPLCLDLHEKHHGPHGLIAGMTGSGKSEIIITYILSMAVNYHPDEVSFVLIDYKGGGLAGAFEDAQKGIRLPHLAGTITNLDGTAVNRALVSIQSELRRRQAVFNEARKVSGEGTIDIYKYQKMYRSGQLDTPVPHLFIISDEFAELKAQQPEFMSQLISTARIGRSLGVHLILATQKPSGVVDDQIWSNSRFRVCLKVQERADSMEMLKRPDAAELSTTGRFYLQVGFNEIFELGQSAWCGAPYLPADRPAAKRDNAVEVIDCLGQVVAEAKPKPVQSGGDGSSQIVSVVRYLSRLADDEQIGARQLWLPPIPEYIYLEQLKERYGWTAEPLVLEPVIGEYDDPYSQSKGLLTLPFTRSGNALLYGATGSGKSVFLETLLCGLLRDRDARELNVYLVDLGEETLRAFEKAPQVGGVLLSSDGEKLQNLFRMLEEELAARKKRFAQTDGDYLSYCRSTGQTLPHILVVLRNYAAFYEQFEVLDVQLAQLTRECFKYGIYFLVTANSANAVRYRVAQNFPNVYSLQLNDQSDYAGLFGRTEGVYPSRLKGRGIFRSDRVYEFQTARFAEDDSLSAVRALSMELRERADSFAPCVPHLPERVTAADFPEDVTPAAFPVGVEKLSLQSGCVDLTRTPVTLLAGQDAQELGATAQGIAEQLSRLPGTVSVLDASVLFAEPEDFRYSYMREGFAGRIESLFQEMVRRNNSYKTAVQAGQTPPEFEPEYYVITGLKTILGGLDAAGKDKLTTLLEKDENAYQVRFLLCDSAAALREFISEGWYKKHVTGTEGIWVGDGIADQYVFRLSGMNNSLYSELPPHFGYLVRKGRPVLTKLIVPEAMEGEEK